MKYLVHKDRPGVVYEYLDEVYKKSKTNFKRDGYRLLSNQEIKDYGLEKPKPKARNKKTEENKPEVEKES